MRASNAEEVGDHGPGDSWEVFTQLIILIVEGRTPGGEKGYHAGPHCLPPHHQSTLNRHVCDQNLPLCARADSLVRQLRLMWGVGVGVSVEVLLAPDCDHGTAITSVPDTSSGPSPYLRLIEQWNFAVFERRLPEASSGGWALITAVRSFLHFSQLSAWLSVSRGSRPLNVLYRVTVTSPVFSSKFDAQPEEHVFPMAYIGQDTSIKVSVRTLPRLNEVPAMFCPDHHKEADLASLCATTIPLPHFSRIPIPVMAADSEFAGEFSTSVFAGSSEDDLRRSMMKTKLSDVSRAPRSESPDTQLGESLLDPPHSLSRITRRFQSPSRSGSPSLETPEHLICKVRHIGPSHARPPDFSSYCPTPRQPLHPFPWTRTRYPNVEHSYSLFPYSQPPKTFKRERSLQQQNLAGASVDQYDHSQPYPYNNLQTSPLILHSGNPPYIWPTVEDSSKLNKSPYSHSVFEHPPLDFRASSSHTSQNCSMDSQSQEVPASSYSRLSFPPSTLFLGKPFTARAQESQGTKRKGACMKESPNKRESPSHLSRDNEDYLEEEEKDVALLNNGSEIETKKGLVNDTVHPSCSKQGKHLCTTKERSEINAVAKSKEICKDDKEYNQITIPKFKSASFKFQLTPKETREVLCVLRENTPHSSMQVDQVTNDTLSKKSKNSLCELPTPKKLLGNSGKDLGKLNSQNKNTTSKGSSSSSYSRWCHKLPASHNEEIEIDCSSNGVIKYKEPFTQTSVEESSNKDNQDFSEKMEDDSSEKEITSNTNLVPKRIETQRIIQRTNYYTVNSKYSTHSSDTTKQVSQALTKSPLSSVLSSIKSVSLQSDDQLCDDDLKRNQVKRALVFPSNNACESSRQKRDHEDCQKEAKELPTTCASVSSSINNGLGCAQPLINRREGFSKSTNLFKKLLKSSYLSQEENSQENKTPLAITEAVTVPDIQKTLTEGLSSLKHGCDNLIEFSTNCQSGTEEDKEVEDLCRAKGIAIPTVSDKVNFRRSLDSAATLVFHNKTGLPLTSSPAPMRKGKSFDYDSSLNSVAAIKCALITCESEEEANENIYKDNQERNRKFALSTSAPATVTCSNLLGSFEECVLNGRLEPVSTVHGFMAEIAASGAFCPKHITKPVTVFFYTLCDNDQISSPYMGHINLGKKGYHIPSRGTVQITLFNPHGTVVKMFVVVYDLSDMPPNSKTFLRQRTLNMPVDANDNDPDAHQWLRYLIHLRFASSKSCKIYLHTDIRMLIFRKSDADAATLHNTNIPYELRSFTNGPSNPKFSPRK